MSTSPQSAEPARGAVLFSACLLGERCRYDGKTKENSIALSFKKQLEKRGVRTCAVCPEELGGLGTPRPAIHLVGGDGKAVLDGSARVSVVSSGRDRTAELIHGCREALRAGGESPRFAVLKARSPSCGSGATWIDGSVQEGDGVFAAAVRRAGACTVSEEDDLHALVHLFPESESST